MTNSIPTNNHQGSLEKWLITSLQQEMYKMSLKYLVTQTSDQRLLGLCQKDLANNYCWQRLDNLTSNKNNNYNWVKKIKCFNL